LDSRLLFDQLVNDHPSFASKLSATASIVKNKDFENGLVKLLQDKESELTLFEKEQLKGFLKESQTSSTRNEVDKNDNYVQRAFKKARIEKESGCYIDVSFVSPTSNICERSFSKAR